MSEDKHIQELPIVFSPITGGHLDQNTVISSVSALDAELPAAKRTIGYPVWVQDEKLHYMFVDGILNAHFKPQEAVNPDHTTRLFSTTINITAASPYELQHNLGTSNVIVQCKLNNSIIQFDVKTGDSSGNNTQSYVTISSNVTLNNVKVDISAKL